MKKLYSLHKLFLSFLFISNFFIVKSQTIVSDSLISGTWTQAESPYLITRDIYIANGTTLAIEPGVAVRFQGHYKIDVQGRLLAIGTKADSIVFTLEDTTGVSLFDTIGWNGIKFYNTPPTNGTSKFEYCVFEYSKSEEYGGVFHVDFYSKIIINFCVFANNRSESSSGGAICVMFASPIITNNIFRNNSASNLPGDYLDLQGGAIYLHFSNSRVINNSFINNFSDYYGGAICMTYSSALIANNTFYKNKALGYGGGIMIGYNYSNDTTLLLNNIFWDNYTNFYGRQISIGNCSVDIKNCDIEGGLNNIYGTPSSYENNIDRDPYFKDITNNNFLLSDSSLCINKGISDTAGLNLPNVDLAGMPRIFNGNNHTIDIGAYEYQGEVPERFIGLDNFGGQERDGAINFSINDNIYIGLGQNDDGVLNDFWRYTPYNDLWTEIDSFPGLPRTNAVAFIVNNKAYIGSGRSTFPYNYYKDFYKLDDETGTWQQIADFGGTARYSAVAFSIDSLGYVGTGNSASGQRGDFWKYNPGTNEWSAIDSVENIRSGATAFSLSGKGYVTGGSYFSGYSVQLSDIQEFDPLTGTWTERIFADGINLSRNNSSVVTLGEKGYLCYGNKSNVVSYCPRTNEVENLGDVLSLVGSRYSPVSFMLIDSAYFGLGSTGIDTTTYYKDMYNLKLTPNFTPTGIILSPDTLNENQAINTIIGILTTTDKNSDDSFLYSLVSGEGDTDNNSFTLDGDHLLSNEEFNFEVKPDYNIRIRTIDAEGAYFEQPLTIIIKNVNDSPTSISLSNDSVNMNTETGTLVGTFNTVDEDISDSFVYELITDDILNSSDNELFSISGDSLFTANSMTTGEELHVAVKSVDKGGLFIKKEFTIFIFEPASIEFYTLIPDNVKIFPNPAGNYITISSVYGNSVISEIIIYNYNGEALIHRSQINSASLNIDLGSLSDGMYMVMIKESDKTFYSKIIKRKQ
jgi:predicted outer membrane repeat protein